jgi:hypothetical protein
MGDLAVLFCRVLSKNVVASKLELYTKIRVEKIEKLTIVPFTDLCPLLPTISQTNSFEIDWPHQSSGVWSRRDIWTLAYWFAAYSNKPWSPSVIVEWKKTVENRVTVPFVNQKIE